VYFDEFQMNPMMSFPIVIEAPTPEITTSATALETYYAVQYLDNRQYLNGRVDVGEIELKDRQGWWWKMKVRWTAERGHFLKFEQISGEKQTFHASTRSSNPSDRLITPDEWEIFAMLVDDRRNYALRMGAQKCLSRLTHPCPQSA